MQVKIATCCYCQEGSSFRQLFGYRCNLLFSSYLIHSTYFKIKNGYAKEFLCETNSTKWELNPEYSCMTAILKLSELVQSSRHWPCSNLTSNCDSQLFSKTYSMLKFIVARWGSSNNLSRQIAQHTTHQGNLPALSLLGLSEDTCNKNHNSLNISKLNCLHQEKYH